MKYIVTSEKTDTKYLIDESDSSAKDFLDALKASKNFTVRPYQADTDTESIWKIFLQQVEGGNH